MRSELHYASLSAQHSVAPAWAGDGAPAVRHIHAARCDGAGPDGAGAGADAARLAEAAELARSTIGCTQPHPNAACVLVDARGNVLASACQRAQGTTPAEVQVALAAGEAARGSVAYLNLESGDCHGDDSAMDALVKAGVSRVVVGIRHPLQHLRWGGAVGVLVGRALGGRTCGRAGGRARFVGRVPRPAGGGGRRPLQRLAAAAVGCVLHAAARPAAVGQLGVPCHGCREGSERARKEPPLPPPPPPHAAAPGARRGKAVTALRQAGITVDVLADEVLAAHASTSGRDEEAAPAEQLAALSACLQANEALLHRAVLRRPMSVLKYAMTLDGKIATTTGHSAWVSRWGVGWWGVWGCSHPHPVRRWRGAVATQQLGNRRRRPEGSTRQLVAMVSTHCGRGSARRGPAAAQLHPRCGRR